MSSAAGTLDGQPTPARQPMPLASVAWLGALLLVCYAPVLLRLGRQWVNDEDMGHGFFVPVVAGYIAWQMRDKFIGRELTPNYWGLLLVGWGALQVVIASLAAELFLARTAFLISLTGVVLTLGGTYALRVLAFPLFLLVFMIPLPAVIYGQITLPLQLFASRVAEWALDMLNIPVMRDGNVLDLASQPLNVVEACSGIRSLLSLTFLSQVYAYFFDPERPWMRWLLLALTIPIAIVANAGRVTLTGILSEINPEWARGFFHSASGWVIFMIALVILIVVHQIIDRLTVFVSNKRKRSVSSAAV